MALVSDMGESCHSTCKLNLRREPNNKVAACLRVLFGVTRVVCLARGVRQTPDDARLRLVQPDAPLRGPGWRRS